MALSKGIWDPKPRGTNIKGTNLKSLKVLIPVLPLPQVPLQLILSVAKGAVKTICCIFSTQGNLGG